jgi:hypothetical protein
MYGQETLTRAVKGTPPANSLTRLSIFLVEGRAVQCSPHAVTRRLCPCRATLGTGAGMCKCNWACVNSGGT